MAMTVPTVLPRKAEGIPEGLPPEEVERLLQVQAKLTDFVLHLIQAFLRTGYYTPEHPESRKAKEGLYQQFRVLFSGEDELSFLIRDEQEKQEILVEGLLPETQRLSRMMLRGMGELYVPKFVKYLERKDLISLTLKSRMGQEEFTRFVDIMSEPSLVDTRRKQDKDRFSQALLGRGILNLSYVFNDELLGSEREMPWRARLILSRMRKDLKMIPHFQKTWGKDSQELQKHLLLDVLRPIRQSDLFCAVLKNSDLAATAEQNEELIENEIVSFLQRQYLLGTGKIFLRDHLDLKHQGRQDAFEKKSDRLVKKISLRLKQAGTNEAENLLEDYFRQNLVALEDLTPSLKDKVLSERLTDKFLAYTDQFFEQLDQAKEKEKFLTVGLSFVKILPELIRRDRYPEVLRIIETLKRHFHQRKMWSLLAGQVLEEIGGGQIPILLREKLLTARKEIRAAIIPIFISLEVGAIPHLLTVLRVSEDQWVRKNACEALIQVGPVAAAHLLKELENPRISVDTVCDILRVLGEIKSSQWKLPLLEMLRRYAAHEHPRLREQALHTICQVGGIEAEEIFLSSLDDPSPEVRKKGAWCLGIVRSERGVGRMLGLLDRITSNPAPATEALETQIYHSLGLAGNLTVGGKTVEEVLIGIVVRRGLKPWWGVFQKNSLSEASLAAISDALGKIGSAESIKVLRKLEKSSEGPVVSKVRDALRRLEERIEP